MHAPNAVFTARQRSCGEVMFSVRCARTSPYRDPPPSDMFNLDLTVQGPRPSPVRLAFYWNAFLLDVPFGDVFTVYFSFAGGKNVERSRSSGEHCSSIARPG